MSNHTVHKYIKKRIGDKKDPYTVWKCMLPGCTHYIKYELGENRFTVCWRCGATTTLDKILMDLTRPHCHRCTRRSKKTEESDIPIDGIQLLTDLFKGA